MGGWNTARFNIPGSLMLETENLVLIPAEEKHLKALIAGDSQFENQFNYKLENGYLEFPDALPTLLAIIQNKKADFDWWSYFIVHKENNKIIGMGGFKNAPDSNGIVEFGYGISTAYRNKGYATEFSKALIKKAFESIEVNEVIAHTLQEINASTRVLEKCSLKKVGEAMDPIDGLVWRWRICRKEYSETT